MNTGAVADTVEGQETPKLFVFYWHFGCLLLGAKPILLSFTRSMRGLAPVDAI